MEKYGRGGRSSGRSGGRDGGYSRPSFGGERKELHKATCDECGAPCQVPFRPTGERPVYCRDCFRDMADADEAPRRDYSRRDDRSGFIERRMFKAVCGDCGKTFELPFKPDGSRPVYCNDCFITDTKPGRAGAAPQGVDYGAEIKRLDEKLEKIMKALEAAGLMQTPVVKKLVKVAKAEVEAIDEEVKPKAKKTKAKEETTPEALEEKLVKKSTRKKAA